LSIDPSGFIGSGTVTINTNVNMVTSCTGYKKVTMHEVGHLMGLNDNFSTNPVTVMNQLGQRDDRQNQMASQVTLCDGNQAYQPQFRP
jgi:hypothetical protein